MKMMVEVEGEEEEGKVAEEAVVEGTTAEITAIQIVERVRGKT
jgi:hypothetical protein